MLHQSDLGVLPNLSGYAAPPMSTTAQTGRKDSGSAHLMRWLCAMRSTSPRVSIALRGSTDRLLLQPEWQDPLRPVGASSEDRKACFKPISRQG